MWEMLISFALAGLTGLYATFMIKTGKTLQWSWFAGQVTRERNPYGYWANLIPVALITVFLIAAGIYSLFAAGD